MPKNPFNWQDMITIHKATLADAMAIADIGEKTLMESHGHSAPIEDMEAYVSNKFALQVIEDELNDPENIIHFIYYRGIAVGYSKMIFNCPQPLIEIAAITKLERLYLLKEFYGLKLGSALFAFVKDLSKKEGQHGMWLFVWKKNERAIAFYKKMEFKMIGSANFKISETHSNPNHVMYLTY